MTEVSLTKALKPLGKDFAVITACKADRCTQDNEAALLRMEHDLKELGFPVRKISGHYRYVETGKEVSEKSFLLNNVSSPLVRDLGVAYEQESVLDKDGLHLLKEDTVVPYAETGHRLGEDAKDTDNWLTLGNNSISLALNFDKKRRDTK